MNVQLTKSKSMNNLVNRQPRHTIFFSAHWVAIAGLMAASLSASFAVAQEPTAIEMTGLTMGPIQYKVIVSHHPKSVEPEALHRDVESALARINQLMSTYIPDSDVSRFNDSNSTEFFEVDAETANVVSRAIEISKITNGAFDITVGPAVNLWKFGPDKSEFTLPSDEAIANVKKVVGYEKLQVRLDPPALRKTEPKLRIDLSAIAKGYAVDQVAKSLDDNGCEGFMVEVGGEVMTRGERAGGGQWRIGVEKPASKSLSQMQIAAQPNHYDHIAVISNMAMATSGDYRNFIEHEGKRFSHTIDPETCRPVTHSMASACIIAPDCMTADALATAMMVMGNKKGGEVCKSLGIKFLIAERSATDDEFVETIAGEFPLLVDPAKADNNQADGIMPTFIAAACVFGLVILAMAVGSIFNNKPVQGSCGGLANMTNEDGETECGICSKPVTDCVENAEATG